MLTLETLTVGPWPVHNYALICPDTRESVLVDAGADAERLVAALAGTTPKAILLTHTHPDHVMALETMSAQLKVPVYAHPNARTSRFLPPISLELLNDGDTFTVGKHTLIIRHTPGHINDMVCLLLDDPRILVGDTIFEGGPGRTWSSEDFQTTLSTLRNIVLTWDDDVVCYPGHGPSFRLGDIRARIEAFLAQDHGDFHGDATW